MPRKLFYIIIFTFILAGCSSSELEDVSVVLDYTPNTNHTGLYVALDQGYYEDAGLDVEIIQPADGTSTQLVASRQVEFGIDVQENVLYAEQEDLGVTAISSISQHNTSGFISLEEKDITRPKDMENKTYCGWGTEIEEALLKEIVENDGGDYSTVEYVVSPTTIFTSDENECDFFWVYEGWDVVNAQLEGLDYNFISITDYGIDFYTPLIITSDTYLEENPEIVRAFVEATREGYLYSYENPEIASEIFIEYVPEYEYEFIYQSNLYMSEAYDSSIPFGYFDPEIYNEFTNLLIEDEILDPSFDYEETYTNEFVE